MTVKVTTVMCAYCRDRGERDAGKLGVLRRAVVGDRQVLHWTAYDKDWARLARRRNPGKMWPGSMRYRGVIGVGDDVRERLPAYCNKCNTTGDITTAQAATAYGIVWVHINRARV